MSKPVLVLGATGTVGRPLVAALAARGAPVRAASRGATPLPGATPVPVDLADPASVGAALDGAGAAYVLLPAGTMDVLGRLTPILDAAEARGVKVVLQSVMGVDADDSIPYRQAELRLERGALPFVILRPNWFMDNFHTYWRAGVRAGRIEVPAGEGASSFVDARDIADAAAAALTTDRFDGRAFDLTGPDARTYAEAAEVLARAAGHPVAYRSVEDAPFVDALAGAGVPRDYAAFLAAIFAPVREGWTARTTDAVETLAGHAPRSLEDYAAAHAAAWR